MSDEPAETPPSAPPATPPERSITDRVVLMVIALMCALFGLPMVYSSGTVVGAMFAGVMPNLWAIGLMPIGLALVYAAIRISWTALTPAPRQP
tara:strand:+ start:57461 stop:57739 length:279 start_codon:yes stop_codon:yes gene_type:complete